MIRNKLYDEFEKEGYSYITYTIQGQILPNVFSLTDNGDWAEVNPSVVVNGRHPINKGDTASEKTIQLLQRLVTELAKPDYSDWYSAALFENKESISKENNND